MAKKKEAPAVPATGGGKFRVEGPQHADALGNRWDKGSVIESDADLTVKFPGVFSRVDDDEEVDPPSKTAAELKAQGEGEAVENKKPSTVPADENNTTTEGTDATDMFEGAKEAGLVVRQTDDGTFVVADANGGETEFADADDVVAHIEEYTTTTKKSKKKK